jgi:hypothetical protein
MAIHHRINDNLAHIAITSLRHGMNEQTNKDPNLVDAKRYGIARVVDSHKTSTIFKFTTKYGITGFTKKNQKAQPHYTYDKPQSHKHKVPVHRDKPQVRTARKMKRKQLSTLN